MRFMTKGDGVEHRIYVRYGPVPGFVAANVVSALTVLACLYLCVRRIYGARPPRTEEDREEENSLPEAKKEKTLET